jgi:hypothetical protein
MRVGTGEQPVVVDHLLDQWHGVLEVAGRVMQVALDAQRLREQRPDPGGVVGQQLAEEADRLSCRCEPVANAVGRPATLLAALEDGTPGIKPEHTTISP